MIRLSSVLFKSIRIPTPYSHLQVISSWKSQIRLKSEMDISDEHEHPSISEHLDSLDTGSRGSRGGRGGGRGRGPKEGRERGARGGANREVDISKALSKLLRHSAEAEGVALDAEGFARLDQVLQWKRLKSLKATFDDIRTAATDNAKQRFSMKANPILAAPPDPSSTDPSDWVIRANQGHTIAVDAASLLVPITLEAGNVPDIVVHGTYFAFYQAILESGGLKRMARNHIHFSTGLPEDKQGVISGMRNDAQILIYVDIRQSLEDGGVLWWISENGVVLTEGGADGVLGTKYFKKVEGRKEDVGLLWENGKEVAKLPPAQQNRKPPRGKETNQAPRKGKNGNRGGRGRGRGREDRNPVRGEDGGELDGPEDTGT